MTKLKKKKQFHTKKSKRYLMQKNETFSISNRFSFARNIDINVNADKKDFECFKLGDQFKYLGSSISSIIKRCHHMHKQSMDYNLQVIDLIEI